MPFFKKPELKTIDHKNERISELLGSSNQWFLNSDLNSIDFDFFIDWRTEAFVPNVFVKKIFKNKESEENFKLWLHEKPNELISLLHKKLSKYKVLSRYNIDIRFLFFNDYEKEPTIYSLSDNKIEVISIDHLKDLIYQYTGRNFKIGSKGLTWATSELERSLSKTNTPYTGDCDLLTFDNNGNILSIFEYQKKFDGQYLLFNELYNGNQKTKFKRLLILQDYLKKQYQENIFLNIIHYSNHQNPKIETILNKNNTIIKTFNERHFKNSNFLNYISSNTHFIQNMIFISTDPAKKPDILYQPNVDIKIPENTVLIIDDNLKSNDEFLKKIKGVSFLFVSDVKINHCIFVEKNIDIENIPLRGSHIIITENNNFIEPKSTNHHTIYINNNALLNKIKILSNQPEFKAKIQYKGTNKPPTK